MRTIRMFFKPAFIKINDVVLAMAFDETAQARKIACSFHIASFGISTRFFLPVSSCATDTRSHWYERQNVPRGQSGGHRDNPKHVALTPLCLTCAGAARGLWGEDHHAAYPHHSGFLSFPPLPVIPWLDHGISKDQLDTAIKSRYDDVRNIFYPTPVIPAQAGI